MPQFLYMVRPTRAEMVTAGPTHEEAAVVGAHFEYLQELLAAKTLLMVGRTQNNDEKTFGIAVFEARSMEEADDVMRNDPAVKAGVMSAELFAYRVALWSTTGPSEA